VVLNQVEMMRRLIVVMMGFQHVEHGDSYTKCAPPSIAHRTVSDLASAEESDTMVLPKPSYPSSLMHLMRWHAPSTSGIGFAVC